VRAVLISCGANGLSVRIEGKGDVSFDNMDKLLDNFKAFLKQPLKTSLLSCSYFHGDLDSEEAEELLHNQPPGTFLLRFSSFPGCFATSYVNSDGIVCKDLISKLPSGEFQLNAAGPAFSSLDSIIDDCKNRGLFNTPFNHQ
jgi:hypothetical protein